MPKGIPAISVPSIKDMWEANVALHNGDRMAAKQEIWKIARRHPQVLIALIKKMFPDEISGNFNFQGFEFGQNNTQ